ncbi:MAG: (2Fe-2S)-binding protein [Pseudomonadales bacterium]|nr:(2Fe-2S)-binding protein [Pseudomonadales bacterium]
MNFKQRQKEPDLVCTCSDLYRNDIQASIAGGCEDAREVMYDHRSQFRCEQCRPIIDRMIRQANLT